MTYQYFSGSRVSLDDIAKTDVIKSGNRPKTAFGSKKIESATPPSRMLTLGKKKTTDKENKSSNQPKPEESQTGGELEILSSESPFIIKPPGLKQCFQ